MNPGLVATATEEGLGSSAVGETMFTAEHKGKPPGGLAAQSDDQGAPARLGI